MKTSIITDTFKIALTEFEPDSDDPTQTELSFEAELSYDYASKTQYAIDDPDALAEMYEHDDVIKWEFNVALRHNTGLYYIIKHDRWGDYYDDKDVIVFAFGQPVYDFIAETCRLLKVPFCAPVAVQRT